MKCVGIKINNKNLYLDEIDVINQKNWSILKFKEKLKNDKYNIIKKIIFVNYYKYDLSFNNNIFFDENINFIKKYILNSDLNTTNIEKMYINIFKHIYKNKKGIGFRNRTKTNMSANNEYGKIGQIYSNHNFIIKEINILIYCFYNDKEHFITRLYSLIINLLSKIHPFPDNNFGTISLLCDLLLLKNGYLPIGLKRTFKENKIFLPSESDFYKIIEARYKNYNY